jgi:hypothetical protein
MHPEDVSVSQHRGNVTCTVPRLLIAIKCAILNQSGNMFLCLEQKHLHCFEFHRLCCFTWQLEEVLDYLIQHPLNISIYALLTDV